MFNVLADTFLTATRAKTYNHWKRSTRFDDTRDARLLARNEGRSDV